MARVLISGMGIAGPTLAYWLARSGSTATIVEHAPHPRRGGYIIDFWGKGYDIAEKMGLMPRLQERGYSVDEVRLVDGDGRKTGEISAAVFKRATHGRYLSLPRTELAEAARRAIENDVETIWGQSITSVAAEGDVVRAAIDGAGEQTYDLVVGADGLHSAVRRIAFGQQTQYEDFLGYKVAAFQAVGYAHRDEGVYVGYAQPGRQIARFSMRADRTMFLLVWRDEDPTMPDQAAEQRSEIHRQFQDCGWESNEILSALDQAENVYFDRVSQIRMPSWTKGRVALVGDAAYSPSLLAGEGAGLAMMGAYVLAGEIARHPNDLPAALANYEQTLRSFIGDKQKSAEKFASSFVPRTQSGIVLRNLVTNLMKLPFVADLAFGGTVKDHIDLPAYW
ncbi:MAG TPA: FAD-binding domain [Hyphomonadaceae bacterium]|nr:FAD-binding domain [Hyphomonadaceae bacterium]